MKYIFTLLVILFCHAAIGQQVGSMVSVVASDGNTYKGKITEIDGEKYKIKYDDSDSEVWLLSSQFKVIEENAPAPAPVIPAPAPEPTTTLPADPQLPPATETQPTPTVPPTTAENPPAKKTFKFSDSLVMAFANLKKAFAVKRDTLTILVTGVEYDNASLSKLKESLKRIKSIKSVGMRYNDLTAVLELAGKGKAAEIWDFVPIDIRSKFQVLEASENNIKLKAR
jgi:hypothetical protein